MITETVEITAALAAAAARWPQDANSSGRLLGHLIAEGHERLRDTAASVLEQRLESILAAQGALAGVYGPDYLTALREEWPA